MSNQVVALKCPLCGKVFTINVNDLVNNNIVCTNCKAKLEAKLFPSLDMKDMYMLSYVNLINNINRLYDLLIKKLEKVL